MNKFWKLFFVLCALVYILLAIFESKEFSDFQIFIVASEVFQNGGNPYENMLYVDTNYFVYFYSPLWGILLIPFTKVPFFWANLFWLLLNLVWLVRIFQLLKKYLPAAHLLNNNFAWVLFLTLGMSARFILHNLELAQMTIFLLWLVLEGFQLKEKQKILLGSLCLALAINIKLLPIVFIPYLMFRGYFKAFVYTSLGVIFFLILPVLYFGLDRNNLLLTEWWSNINPMASNHLIETELSLHSLNAALPVYLDLINWNLKENEIGMLINILKGFIILSTLLFTGFRPFRQEKDRIMVLRELSFLCLVIPLIFPHQQKYAFFLMLPALFLCNYMLVTNWKKQLNVQRKSTFRKVIVALSVVFVLTTLSTDGVIGKDLNRFTQEYKFITLGALVLIYAVYQTKLLIPKEVEM